MYVSLSGLGQDDDITDVPDDLAVQQAQQAAALQAAANAEKIQAQASAGLIDTTTADTYTTLTAPPVAPPVAASVPSPTLAIPAPMTTAVVLPNGVAINPAALTPAQLQMTPAQLQAQLYPAGTAQPAAGTTGAGIAVGTPVTALTTPTPVPFNLSAWLSSSTILAGVTNQSVALGGILFGGALAVILNKKKGKR